MKVLNPMNPLNIGLGDVSGDITTIKNTFLTQPLSSYSVGSIVKFKVNGVDTEFIIVN
jgi:transcriptional accessory protein Tex/SPT6